MIILKIIFLFLFLKIFKLKFSEDIFDKTWGIFPGMLLGTAEDSVKRNPRETK